LVVHLTLPLTVKWTLIGYLVTLEECVDCEMPPLGLSLMRASDHRRTECYPLRIALPDMMAAVTELKTFGLEIPEGHPTHKSPQGRRAVSWYIWGTCHLNHPRPIALKRLCSRAYSGDVRKSTRNAWVGPTGDSNGETTPSLEVWRVLHIPVRSGCWVRGREGQGEDPGVSLLGIRCPCD
jgi:hypothetical protein